MSRRLSVGATVTTSAMAATVVSGSDAALLRRMADLHAQQQRMAAQMQVGVARATAPPVWRTRDSSSKVPYLQPRPQIGIGRTLRVPVIVLPAARVLLLSTLMFLLIGACTLLVLPAACGAAVNGGAKCPPGPKHVTR